MTSTQRRMAPSAEVAIVGPQHQESAQQRHVPHDRAGRRTPRFGHGRLTPSAVMPAAYQSLTSVPRGKNCTDSMLGSAMPRKQAGIQMTS